MNLFQSTLKCITKFLITIICFFIHLIHRITGNPVWLMWEFRFLAFVGNHVQNLAITIICYGYTINLVMRFITPELKLISTVIIVTFLIIWMGLSIRNYRRGGPFINALIGNHFMTSIAVTISVYTLIDITRFIFDVICDGIQFIIATLWNNYYLYHSDIVIKKLMDKYQQHHDLCTALENDKRIPKFMKDVIIKQSFHPRILALSNEHWVNKYLTADCELDKKIVHEILGYVFGDKSEKKTDEKKENEQERKFISFEICYPTVRQGLIKGDITTPSFACGLSLIFGQNVPIKGVEKMERLDEDKNSPMFRVNAQQIELW